MTLTTENTKVTEIFTEDINALSGRIIECGIEVRKKLGPGLLESAYQLGLAHLLLEKKYFLKKKKQYLSKWMTL